MGFIAHTSGFVVSVSFLISSTAVAQQPVPSEPLRAFGDQRNWIVERDIKYEIGNTKVSIIIPAGFVTDLASIPQELWAVGLTPTGQYGRAAIVHDYLYWSQRCTRDQADRLLVIAMKESVVNPLDAFTIYVGVHTGGSAAWDENAKLRADGSIRTLPAGHMRPEDPNMHWPEYRQGLIDAGVKDASPVDDGSYCHYGDTTEVPGATTTTKKVL